jgi:tetratricopeptide (TPR) repeat protein
LFTAAQDASGSVTDRLAAALRYCRSAFFSANWEGIAIVAGAGLDVVDALSVGAVDGLVAASASADDQADAIEFEPAVVRTVADVTAFLYKVLGIQATFRGRQDDALDYFRAMRDRGEGLSPELRAQSCLYTALTLSKRYGRNEHAVAELAEGFEAVAPATGERDSVRRERGWLHNLRGLTHFAQHDLRAALESEKSALDCIHGLRDASSVHLRVNLLSNISVLQEAAKMYEPARQTWARFRDAAGADNPSFAKHHAYREAGLTLRLGDADEALAGLAQAIAAARLIRDDFHEYEISLEAAAMLVDRGRPAKAMEHLDAAAVAARRLGDPYRIAVASAGRAGCGAPDAPGAEEIARMAVSSTTYPSAAAELAERVRTSRADLLGLLPRPRTKLNRPFETINF